MATKQHCAYCFSVLLAQLQHTTFDVAPTFDTSTEYPLFVTWNKQGSDGQEQLRGCIGNFSPMNLATGLREYAITSAFHDTRFSPIRAREVPQLSCSVSLLTDFEDANGYLDWKVGTHGVWIEFRLRGRRTTATFLPEIAEEQGWSKKETIDHLLRKGGFELPITDDVRSSIKLTRYQSKKQHLSYAEYVEMTSAK
ncbi:hypothetical protein LPJ77_005291 [Coemansia sp. RSA 2523]|nr:hypothetical protein LPJ54_004817 [Coemansia sp. RSA 1824]KAJ1787512.1 hypothetical protein LPJ62_003321 [Coemansia sp. RSA 2167]KAJ1803357.1 hypothetical protein LPJ77_005291 [Coemansia sp. RSA 2523]KAJ2144074.1 hypothetical protein IW142_003362 [Coemansia sp. RSA 564]KAJ2145129.1 hypothetical protein J3F82_005041 [Coemansia sp. RSA 637]KAJ2168642.1 hypothetical protein GGH15_001221 [Coemansia sp. RSA 562]KAJ2177665.1 hypothetical protein GGF45_003182 [Coemansia sp. RSA 551]KAJ2190934.1 